MRNSVRVVSLVLLMGCGHKGSASQEKTGTQEPVAAEADVTSLATLCQTDERIVFSCSIEGKGKIASVCASPDLEEEGRHIVYRYGRPGNIELTYPEMKAGSFAKFFYSAYTRPLLTRQSLRFLSNGYEYVIEVESNSEEGPSSYVAGISISGSKSLELGCKSEGIRGVDVNVQDALPCDSESAWADYSCVK